MGDDVLVSIIIPIYNSDAYLAETIESVLNQTYQGIEVFLVNDGSKDNSLAICNHYAALDSRIRVFTKENQGVSLARNLGIKEAKGKYIQFVDADDVVPVNSTKKLVESAEHHHAEIVIGGFEEKRVYKKNKVKLKSFVEQEKIVSSKEIAANYSHYKKNKMINALWNKLFKSELIKKNQILFNPDFNLGEDLLFNLSCLRLSRKNIIVEEVVYTYFIRLGYSLSQKYYKNKHKLYQQLLDSEKQFAEEFDTNISDYLMSAKIYEGISQIETIVSNKQIPFFEKKELIERTRLEWGLNHGYNKNPINHYHHLFFHSLKRNNYYFLMMICRVKLILKTIWAI